MLAFGDCNCNSLDAHSLLALQRLFADSGGVTKKNAFSLNTSPGVNWCSVARGNGVEEENGGLEAGLGEGEGGADGRESDRWIHDGEKWRKVWEAGAVTWYDSGLRWIREAEA